MVVTVNRYGILILDDDLDFGRAWNLSHQQYLLDHNLSRIKWLSVATRMLLVEFQIWSHNFGEQFWLSEESDPLVVICYILLLLAHE